MSPSYVNFTYKILEGPSLEVIVEEVNRLTGWKIVEIFPQNVSDVLSPHHSSTSSTLDRIPDYEIPKKAFKALLVKEEVISHII